MLIFPSKTFVKFEKVRVKLANQHILTDTNEIPADKIFNTSYACMFIVYGAKCSI